MAETELVRQRASPGISETILTGTTTITFTNGLTTADSAAITFDPPFSATPKLIGLTTEDVAETNSPTRGPFSAGESPGTLSATGITFTGYTTDPGGVGKQVVFTIRYTLSGEPYQT